jgi:methionyl-tRNA synthetase
MEKQKIDFKEFLEIEKKLEIRVGYIITAERIPKSDKLLKLNVSFADGDSKTVVTNIGNKIEPEELFGISCPFIMNLTPSKMMGIISEAMIVVGETTNGKIEIRNYSIGTKLL